MKEILEMILLRFNETLKYTKLMDEKLTELLELKKEEMLEEISFESANEGLGMENRKRIIDDLCHNKKKDKCQHKNVLKRGAPFEKEDF